MSLDLYFKVSDNVTFSVVGKNLVHLTGYWEPNTDLNNEELGFEGLEMVESPHEEEEEEDDSDDTAQKLKVA